MGKNVTLGNFIKDLQKIEQTTGVDIWRLWNGSQILVAIQDADIGWYLQPSIQVVKAYVLTFDEYEEDEYDRDSY